MVPNKADSMKYAFISQFYWPHVGGAQRVVQEIAEKMASLGNEVEVLTSWEADRSNNSLNGVKIKSFKIRGNQAKGLVGEVQTFQEYLQNGSFDFIFIYAAQHWGLDAFLPILDLVKARKVHVPCGYSGLKNPDYKIYFEEMKEHLKKFDLLIYHSKSYQDYIFADSLNLKNLVLIPNAASYKEFEKRPNPYMRKKLGLSNQDKILLTIGSPPFAKGHLDVIKIFKDDFFDSNYTLILNGNYRLENWKNIAKEILKIPLGKSIFTIYFQVVLMKIFKRKKIHITNLKRDDLISLLFESNLFLFMSHVEYSPLVLFEAVAAGLPFVSTPSGNSSEIATWTEGGIVSTTDTFIESVKKILIDEKLLKEKGNAGRRAFLERYNWKLVTDEYVQKFKDIS